jgi:hypothetical protein
MAQAFDKEHVPNFVEFECGAPDDSFGKLLLEKQTLRKERHNVIILCLKEKWERNIKVSD